jgi:membrane-associated phospholipid phosphatase
MRKPNTSEMPSRRGFLGSVCGVTAASLVAGSAGLPALAFSGDANASVVSPTSPGDRANRAYQFRHKAALDLKKMPLPPHPVNGDDGAYASFIGSYSKGLPHNALGEVTPAAYEALMHALKTGDPADFDRVPAGGTVKQTHPQSAYCYELDGVDPNCLAVPAPPAFSGEDAAAELCELYWQALARDIPFSRYGTDPLIARAVKDLRQFRKFAGVDASSIFRGDTPGELVGPYISQFLLKPYNFGAQPVTQRFRTTLPGNDFMTRYDEWLKIQNGGAPTALQTFDSKLRHVRNGRDLTEWVHQDFTYQGFLVAALILLGSGPNAVDDSNPYKGSANQSGFTCFGAPHVLDLVARAANLGLKAAWFQKWAVHRRLRPEAYAGSVHNFKTGAARHPVHALILDTEAARETFNRFGSYLLPMAYPEGSPTHPAYPSGHAAIAGACATVLKAYFKESFAVPSPVVATDDGLGLNPYAGTLTVGNELNKLAANVAVGRDIAGVHWRSDAIEGIKLGEQVGIGLMRDYRRSYNETFAGFSFTKFDGTSVNV